MELPIPNASVGEDDNDENTDSDDDFIDSDSGDEEDDESNSNPHGFTFLDPYSSGVVTATPTTDQQLAQMAVYQGVAKDKNVRLRFIIGVKEYNRFPGKAPGEIDLFRRKWVKLMTYSRKFHWRRVFHNSFEGDYYYPAVPFVMDGIEWKTVTHFLLGMLYRNHPSYADLYSLRARHIKDGWWGKVDSALVEHNNNILGKKFPPDPEFGKYVDGYVQRALLAKFTQYPALKQALLLTEDAVFAVREGPDRVNDFPALSKVRDIISRDPTLVFKGDSVTPERDIPDVPFLFSSEELNFNYVDLQAAAGTPEERKVISDGLVAGGIHLSSIYNKPDIEDVIKAISPSNILTFETIESCDQIVFVAAGAYRLALEELSDVSQVSFVRRHLYALERIADNQDDRIMIATQTTPCSQKSDYLHFSVNINPNRPPANLYLEPLKTSAEGTWDYGIQIVCDNKDPLILEYLRHLIDGSFVSPATLLDEDSSDSESDES